jgi:hypothetical protein
MIEGVDGDNISDLGREYLGELLRLEDALGVKLSFLARNPAAQTEAWLRADVQELKGGVNIDCLRFGLSIDHSLTAVRAHSGRLSALCIYHSKSLLYGTFVWVHRALNSPKRRFPARAAAQNVY